MVEVRRHGWQSARAHIAGHLLATVKRLQEEEPGGRLRQELIEDRSDDAPTSVVTRISGAGHTASAAKRKSSGSATRGESELRKQLLHISKEMDKSEKARMELEERVSLFEDALRHRDESMHELEICSNYNFELYQENVTSEVEYMRESL